MRRLLSVLLLVAGIRAADTALTQFHLPLSAVDPVLQYQPIGPRTADTGGHTDTANAPTGAASVTSDGWEITYSGVDLSADKITFSTLGAGTPKRSTSTPNATVTVNWVGTGVWFYGNTTEATGFEVFVDGHPTLVNGTSGLLGGIDDLPYKQHQAWLKVNSGTVDVYGATLTTGLNTQRQVGILNAPPPVMLTLSPSNNLTTKEVSTVSGADKDINPAFQATSTGNTPWAARWDWAGTAWDHIGTTGQYALLSYVVDSNTSYLALYGGTAGWNGDYQVSFTPSLDYEATGSKGSEYSTWRGQDVVLWAGPLDPSVNYTMTLKTLLDRWWIDVSKVKLWSALDPSQNTTSDANTSTENSGTPIGAIVGGVVGGIALIALVLLGLFFYRRKKRTATSPLDILDVDDEYTTTPYQTRETQQYSQQGYLHSSLLAPVGGKTADDTQHVDRPQSLNRTYTDLSSPGTEGTSLLSPYGPTTASASSSSAGLGMVGNSSGTASRPPKSAARPRVPREITRQEEDGGVVVNLVPPSYDPRWAAGAGGSQRDS